MLSALMYQNIQAYVCTKFFTLIAIAGWREKQ